MTNSKSEYDIADFVDENTDSNDNILSLIQSNSDIGNEVAKNTEVLFASNNEFLLDMLGNGRKNCEC